jgi:hypothetical protein
MRAHGGLVVGLVALLVAGCAGHQSRADACRTSNAFRRAGRGLQGKPNATADAVEDLRCDLVEANETATDRQRRAEAQASKAADDQERAAQQQSNRQLDAQLENIRRAPNVPELGATVAEAQVLCQQQRGAFISRTATLGCKIRGQTLFACSMDSGGQADRCDGFYEAADFGATRRSVETKLGPAAKESVSADGFRVFEWAGTAEIVIVTMYARGVRMTRARARAEAEVRSP